MKKNGFTLVELLAVIIILALIALIIVPIVLDTIEVTDKKSFEISTKEVATNIDKYLMEKEIDKLSECNEEQVKIRDIEFLKNRTTFTKKSYICYNEELDCDYIYAKSTKGGNKAIIASGCVDSIAVVKADGSQDTTVPGYTTMSYARRSSSITVYIDWKDEESEIKEIKYKIREKGTEKWTEWQSSNTFTKLKNNTKYEIKSKAINKENLIGIATGETTTQDIDAPLITPSSSEWASSKIITIKYPTAREGEKYTYSYSLDRGNTWTEATEETTKITFNKNGTIIARVYDGTNYKTANAYTETKIDTCEPVVELKPGISSGTWTDQNIKIKANWYCKANGNKGGESGYSYQWYKDGNEIAGATSNEYTATEIGNYTVRVTLGSKSNATATYKANIDKTTPSCNLMITSGTKGNNGWYTSNATVQLIATTGASGISYSVPTLSTSSTYNTIVSGSGTVSSSTTFTSEGKQTIRGYVKNGVGKTNTCSLSLNIDKTGPSLVLPHSISQISDHYVQDDYEVKVTDNLSGISTAYCDVRYKKNSEHFDDFVILSAIGKTNYDFKMQTGEYYFKCSLVDIAGNQKEITTNATNVKSVGYTHDWYPINASKNVIDEGETVIPALYYRSGPVYGEDSAYNTKNLYMLYDSNNSFDDPVGIQYGPYMKIYPGCYKITYYGSKLNTLDYSSYSNEGAIYDLINLSKNSTNTSYYVSISGTSEAYSKNGVEFVAHTTYTGNLSSAPYITKVHAECVYDKYCS